MNKGQCSQILTQSQSALPSRWQFYELPIKKTYCHHDHCHPCWVWILFPGGGLLCPRYCWAEDQWVIHDGKCPVWQMSSGWNWMQQKSYTVWLYSFTFAQGLLFGMYHVIFYFGRCFCYRTAFDKCFCLIFHPLGHRMTGMPFTSVIWEMSWRNTYAGRGPCLVSLPFMLLNAMTAGLLLWHWHPWELALTVQARCVLENVHCARCSLNNAVQSCLKLHWQLMFLNWYFPLLTVGIVPL